MFPGFDDATPPAKHLPRGLLEVVRQRLTERALRRYLDWRDECSDVELAYRAWRHALTTNSACAFGAYSAALDREQRAAARYGEAIDDGRRLLAAAQSP